MTKAAPQLNIFSIGFSIAQVMGLLIIWITLDNFTAHFFIIFKDYFKQHLDNTALRDEIMDVKVALTTHL